MADVQMMLTTADNPYDPFTHWAEWYAFDISHGYDTSGYLARVLVSSDELSQADQSTALIDAMNSIILNDNSDLYRIVTSSESVSTNS
jgi:hypothetical protein